MCEFTDFEGSGPVVPDGKRFEWTNIAGEHRAVLSECASGRFVAIKTQSISRGGRPHVRFWYRLVAQPELWDDEDDV